MTSKPFAINTFRAVIIALALACASPASAGELTAFLARPTPTETWSRGFGGTFSSTWFRAVAFEAEFARQQLDSGPVTEGGSGMTSFSGSALLAPPIGPITPFGGLSIGVFRQTLGSDSDTGIIRAFVLGAKMRIGGLLVVRGEYRTFELSGNPLLPADRRFSLGAGVAF